MQGLAHLLPRGHIRLSTLGALPDASASHRLDNASTLRSTSPWSELLSRTRMLQRPPEAAPEEDEPADEPPVEPTEEELIGADDDFHSEEESHMF